MGANLATSKIINALKGAEHGQNGNEVYGMQFDMHSDVRPRRVPIWPVSIGNLPV